MELRHRIHLQLTDDTTTIHATDPSSAALESGPDGKTPLSLTKRPSFRSTLLRGSSSGCALNAAVSLADSNRQRTAEMNRYGVSSEAMRRLRCGVARTPKNKARPRDDVGHAKLRPCHSVAPSRDGTVGTLLGTVRVADSALAGTVPVPMNPVERLP
jgi:hypothetical protein